MNREAEVFRLLQPVCGLFELLRHDGVQCNVGARDGIGGAHHTELELVAGEGKGRGPVPVGHIRIEIRQGVHTGLQVLSLLGVHRVAGTDELLHHILQLCADEAGQDGGRCLVRTETVVIAHIGRRKPQKICMPVHRRQYAGQHQKELDVLMGRVTRVQEVDAVIRGEGPVVVLAGAIDALKGLLVQETNQTMAAGRLLQHLHHQLVVICREIRLVIDRCQLVLCRCHLVVLGLRGDAQSPELHVHIPHEIGDPVPDGAEVMIIQLLSLGRHHAEEGSAGIYQILPLQILLPVDEEVLLLRAHRGLHGLRCGIAEETQDPQRLGIDGLHGPEQRCLGVQGLAREGTEGRGNAQSHCISLTPQEGRTGAVPNGITPGLKGGPQTAGGEGRGIRLAAYQLLAGKLHHDLALCIRGRNEGIVLLRSNACQRLEPVGIVGCAVFDGPLLHGMGHGIRDRGIQLIALGDGFLQLPVDAFRQTLPHDAVVEDVLSEDLCDGFVHFTYSLRCKCVQHSFLCTLAERQGTAQALSQIHSPRVF